MKNLLIVFLLSLAMLASCKVDKKPSFDPATKVALNGQLSLQSVAGKAKPEAPYSLETIARYALDIGVYSDGAPAPKMRGIMKHDLASNKIYIGDMHDVVRVIDGKAELGGFVTTNIHDVTLRAAPRKDAPDTWIDAYEFWDLEGFKNDMSLTLARDTIGYVPNRVIRDAESKIKTAFEAGDYEECMRLFEQAYIFIPITGEEWRALKAKNEQ